VGGGFGHRVHGDAHHGHRDAHRSGHYCCHCHCRCRCCCDGALVCSRPPRRRWRPRPRCP
jgi:hypothetical protein